MKELPGSTYKKHKKIIEQAGNKFDDLFRGHTRMHGYMSAQSAVNLKNMIESEIYSGTGYPYKIIRSIEQDKESGRIKINRQDVSSAGYCQSCKEWSTTRKAIVCFSCWNKGLAEQQTDPLVQCMQPLLNELKQIIQQIEDCCEKEK